MVRWRLYHHLQPPVWFWRWCRINGLPDAENASLTALRYWNQRYDDERARSQAMVWPTNIGIPPKPGMPPGRIVK